TFPPLKLTVPFWNNFEKSVREFEIPPWELHLRRTDVFVHKKQTTWFQSLLDLIEQMFELKNMMQRCVRVNDIVSLLWKLRRVQIGNFVCQTLQTFCFSCFPRAFNCAPRNIDAMD